MLFFLSLIPLHAYALDGQALYEQQCANCHGQKGEIRALGKSRKLLELNSDALVESIKSYQRGDRNNVVMGKLMQSRVKDLKEDEIIALAGYVASLHDVPVQTNR